MLSYVTRRGDARHTETVTVPEFTAQASKTVSNRPAPPASGPRQAAPPPPPGSEAEAAAIAAVALVLGAGFAGATIVAAKLATVLRPFGIGRRATVVSWELALSGQHLGGPYPPRTARRATYRLQLQRSAAYLFAAARRLQAAINKGTLREAIALERRYAVAHHRAQANRHRAAGAVDAATAAYGTTLGWYAHNDKRTTTECRQAHGRNFRPDAMPAIGFPGAVHPHCRCVPGPPWPQGAMMVSRRAAA